MFKTDWLIFALSVFKEINDALLLCTKVELQVRVFENKIVPYQDAVIGGARIEKKSLFHGTLFMLALCFITTISPNTCSVQKTTVRHFSCSYFCFFFFCLIKFVRLRAGDVNMELSWIVSHVTKIRNIQIYEIVIEVVLEKFAANSITILQIFPFVILIPNGWISLFIAIKPGHLFGEAFCVCEGFLS